MNAHILAKSAYTTKQPALRTPRGIEAEIFTRITAKLSRAASDQGSFATLVAALNENRRFWTALAADVAEDGNTLPDPLRAQIFYLAEFTAQHTSKILSGKENAGVLIDINTAMLRGLNGQGAEA
ncbi:flagellar biosynthesis regulator FlaF [Actibacterium ureilyticum]|uniref:flagellar biosynthesis regulator FlaF n=1 Tax=Actibacterium ureilyticum TaxID=1590614 RepID=UPI000BAB07B0|nr:flagellar biosynthesis regulator FlaF [Actibacterium ureilyticum]